MTAILALPTIPLDDVIFYALTIAATLAVAYLIVRIISGLVGRLESSRRIRIHVAALFRTLASAVVYAGAVLALLYMFIVSLEVILLVVGAFVIAFIIMSRDILTNVAAYYALAISVPSKRGDFVEVGAVKGRVLRRNMLFTEIRSEEGRTIDVPNVVFLRNPTTVHLGSSLTKVSISVKIDGGADLTKAEGVLYNVVSSHVEFTKPPAPAVCITDIRNDYTEFSIHGYVTNPHKVDSVASDLRKRVREALETAKINLF